MTQTLLCLPGIGSDADSWADLASALAPRARTVVEVPQGNSIEAMARDMLARVPGSFAVAGHSMGGYVALALCALAPDRVTHLAMVNSGAGADSPDQARRRATGLARLDKLGFAATAAQIAPATLPPGADPALVARVEAMILRTGEARYRRDQQATGTRGDFRPMLATLRLPTLIIGGAQDRIVDPAASTQIAQHIAHATLVMLSNCGHMAPMEAPEVIAGSIATWLGS